MKIKILIYAIFKSFRISVRHLRCCFQQPAAPPSAKPVWEGVYTNFRDIPVIGKGFDDDEWLRQYRGTIALLQHEYSKAEDRSPSNYGEHHLLCLLASTVIQSQDKLNILDFGGGLAPGYIHLKNTIACPDKISYCVVDIPKMCLVGAEMFRGDSQIKFTTNLTSDFKQIDIIYINSALQYIEDYDAKLKQLCTLKPFYILFVRLNGGDIETFATVQTNIPGSLLAYWFLDVRQLIILMNKNGYKLLWRGFAQWAANMSNFPESCRLDGTANLLFVRQDSR
jgi:putative methyltransferase (TIGR04325 family)